MSALGYGVALDAKDDRIDVRDTRAEAERDGEILTGDALPAVLHTTVVALVPVDEYDAMVADITRLAAIDALHNLITDGTTGETWCGECGPGYPCLTRLALNSPVERSEEPARAHP